jgi:hypothetical protein
MDWSQLSGNIAGGLALIYLIVDTIRNWGGSPELKVLRNDMQQNHQHMEALIKALSKQRTGR